jgi:hypothetical protein
MGLKPLELLRQLFELYGKNRVLEEKVAALEAELGRRKEGPG